MIKIKNATSFMIANYSATNKVRLFIITYEWWRANLFLPFATYLAFPFLPQLSHFVFFPWPHAAALLFPLPEYFLFSLFCLFYPSNRFPRPPYEEEEYGWRRNINRPIFIAGPVGLIGGNRKKHCFCSFAKPR
jgi:hypothetical protein